METFVAGLFGSILGALLLIRVLTGFFDEILRNAKSTRIWLVPLIVGLVILSVTYFTMGIEGFITHFLPILILSSAYDVYKYKTAEKGSNEEEKKEHKGKVFKFRPVLVASLTLLFLLGVLTSSLMLIIFAIVTLFIFSLRD